MNFISAIFGWLILLLGLALSIGLHELGHLLPAKKFGVKVTKYMIGFGPTIFSRKKGETEYGIKAIPLGGYIQMVGMLPPASAERPLRGWKKLSASVRPSEPDDNYDEERAFYKLAPWKKLIVMFGGPFANLLIALVLTFVLFCGFGAYERSNVIHDVVACIPTDSNPNCDKVGEPSPAKVAGLQKGDKVLSFNGVKVEKWAQIENTITNSAGESVTLLIERAGKTSSIKITPAKLTLNGQTRGYLGVYIESVRFKQNPVEATVTLGSMLSGTAEMIIQLPAQAVQAAAELAPRARRSDNGAISIIGMGQYSSQLVGSDQLSAEDKVLSQMALLLGLNVALFVFNMVPLVPLDGGHIAGALYESAKRGVYRIRGKKLEKPVDTSQMMPVAYLVAALLLGLTVLLMLRDILNPVHF